MRSNSLELNTTTRSLEKTFRVHTIHSGFRVADTAIGNGSKVKGCALSFTIAVLTSFATVSPAFAQTNYI